MSRKHDMEVLADAMISGIPFAARGENPEKALPRKPVWPDWPFFWMNERSMDALREIASRLKDKTTSNLPSGIKGEMTPVERQMYDIISELQQHFGELHDAFQASLQIIDDNRPSQRLKRLFGRITAVWQEAILRLRNSTALTILGAVGAVVLVVTILRYVLHYFGR
jgi:hypothetical protein